MTYYAAAFERMKAQGMGVPRYPTKAVNDPVYKTVSLMQATMSYIRYTYF